MAPWHISSVVVLVVLDTVDVVVMHVPQRIGHFVWSGLSTIVLWHNAAPWNKFKHSSGSGIPLQVGVVVVEDKVEVVDVLVMLVVVAVVVVPVVVVPVLVVEVPVMVVEVAVMVVVVKVVVELETVVVD